MLLLCAAGLCAADAASERLLDQFLEARQSIGGPEEASVNYGATMLFTPHGLYKAVLLRAVVKDPDSGEQLIRHASTIKLFDENGDITDKISGQRVNYIYPVSWLDPEEMQFHSYLVAHHFPGQYSVFEVLEGGVLSQVLRVKQGNQSGQVSFIDTDGDSQPEVLLRMADFMDMEGSHSGEVWYRGKYLQFPREAEESHSGVVLVLLDEQAERAFRWQQRYVLE